MMVELKREFPGEIMTKWCYESVFMHAPYQFCGHVDEYFIARTKHLCILYFETRFGTKRHRLRRYEGGELVEERPLSSSNGRIGYYLHYWFNHVVELWKFSRGRSRTLVACGHPVEMFGMTILKLFRCLSYSYWIGDYFPDRRFVIRAYERVKKFYHGRADYVWYLSDPINRMMNGGQVRTDARHHTVSWGLRLHEGCEVDRGDSRRILFVGLLRSGQGIERLLAFVAAHQEYALSLIGNSANGYDRVITEMIVRLGIGERVLFPNRFYSTEELDVEARRCFVGMALYDLAADNFTHYADPGKVKAYVEMGLPVVMTRISDVVNAIEKFKSGEIVDSMDEVGAAVDRIAKGGSTYRKGVLDFAAHYDFERYYAEGFRSYEEVWG